MVNFDEVISRVNTNSVKWDKYIDRDIIPLWVADMDFKSPMPIIMELKKKVEHGIFGYSNFTDILNPIVQNHLQRKYNWRITTENIIWLPSLVVGINHISRTFVNSNQAIITATPIYPPL